jgi:hypothetical protein
MTSTTFIWHSCVPSETGLQRTIDDFASLCPKTAPRRLKAILAGVEGVPWEQLIKPWHFSAERLVRASKTLTRAKLIAF